MYADTVKSIGILWIFNFLLIKEILDNHKLTAVVRVNHDRNCKTIKQCLLYTIPAWWHITQQQQ